MRRFGLPCRVSVVLALLVPFTVCGQKPFDSHANAEQDLDTAKRVARLENKLIFLDFGANWCPGCVEIDRDIQQDVDLKFMMQSFVVVHANVGGVFSRDKHTDVVRAHYPSFRPIPQYMILDADGNLLRQSDGDALTSDKKHNVFSKALLIAFLNGPAPSASSTPNPR